MFWTLMQKYLENINGFKCTD